MAIKKKSIPLLVFIAAAWILVVMIPGQGNQRLPVQMPPLPALELTNSSAVQQPALPASLSAPSDTSAEHPIEQKHLSTQSSFLPATGTLKPSWSLSFYVDSSHGNDQYDCHMAQFPATPKKTVAGVLSCKPGPGHTIYLRGTFQETISPNRSGRVLFDVQDIEKVEGSIVSFKRSISGVFAKTDYIAIYGSRSGNSGAFAIISVLGNQVMVDTSSLPGGRFTRELASDPGDLQAAILRPVHFTAWDRNNPPVFSGFYQAYHAVNQRVIMVSYVKSVGGNSVNPGYYVWPAFEIDGSGSGNSDFQIFDHLEVTNAESAIAIEADEFQSSYDIIQFCNLHNIGAAGNASDEIIYFGYAYRPDLHHDFVQIVYNKIGPHRSDSTIGDGIDLKPSAHNATIFGNELVGLNPGGCDDAPIKAAGTGAFIANNYLHDIIPATSKGCGISIVDDEPNDPTSGGEWAIVVNNIIANVKGVGIRILDADNVQLLNNTIYNILPEPNCDNACMEFNMGIEVHNWQGSVENIVINNNIVQSVYIGIGRYIGSNNELPVSILSDYNLVFDSVYPFRGSITQNTHDLIIDPNLVDPQNYDFSLMTSSLALDSGQGLSGVFSIDHHAAANPTLPIIAAPSIRTGKWDRGVYEK